jgi:hypothetical protein
MAERSDVHVEWWRSPRVIVVEAPSTTISLQDLVDTIRGLQEPILDALDDKRLIDAGGKEELGGGSLVNITVTLQNAQLAFEQRPIVAESGVTTSGQTTDGLPGKILTSTSSDFDAADIQPGDVAINFTDNSVATVIEKISSTQVKTYELQGGSDNTWESGDSFGIWHSVECNLQSGNLVAVDENGDPIPALLSTAFTTVSKESSASGTTQELEAIQYASYQNAVWVDTNATHQYAGGTEFPSGTREYPVNNIQNAVYIGNEKGFSELALLSNITLGAGDDVSDFSITGKNPTQTTLVISTAAVTNNCRINNLLVTGVLDGNATIDDCFVMGPLEYIYGYIRDSIIAGKIILGGNQGAAILNCYSHSDYDTTVDMGGSGNDLMVRHFSGRLILENLSGANDISVDLVSGEVDLLPTISNGTIDIRGVGTLVDNSTGTAVVDDSQLLNRELVSYSVWEEILTGATHNTPSSAGRRLRELAGTIITAGTAQTGSTNNTIMLNGNASTVDGAYDPAMIAIVGGTGSGQCRGILEYEGSTKKAVVDRNWKITPDDTSEYVIYAWPGREHVNEGLAQAGGTNTITLNALASASDDAYEGQTVFIRSGTGEDQSRQIVTYDGTTKIATVERDWDVVPDATSGYVILGQHTHLISEITDGIFAHEDAAGISLDDAMIIIRRLLENKVTRSGDIISVFEENGTTLWRQFDLSSGGRVEV